jgi:hypothetical protein
VPSESISDDPVVGYTRIVAMVAFADESIYGEWSRTAHNEGCEAGNIQQVDLITRRAVRSV